MRALILGSASPRRREILSRNVELHSMRRACRSMLFRTNCRMDGAESDRDGDGLNDLGEYTLEVAPERIVEVCRFLKEQQEFIRLSTVTGVDRYPAEPRFDFGDQVLAHTAHDDARRRRGQRRPERHEPFAARFEAPELVGAQHPLADGHLVRRLTIAGEARVEAPAAGELDGLLGDLALPDAAGDLGEAEDAQCDGYE